MNKSSRCETCNKLKPIDRSTLAAGDRVTFTFSTQRVYRTHIKCDMRTVKGRVQQIQGEQVTVIYRKKPYQLNVGAVNPAGAPSELAYAMIGTCTCGVCHEH
ncbi:conserved hypothetical protein [Xenorhabdus bovienii str. oregonense]|uniref:Uncharacterized protein n=1 Tax=Xenorhabdus bovienii str. oregonense TaxID=1398202 RepID=A0A077P2U1_XENBV|nr:hypothetical protein [Xenorhabdus bovienii]CDH05013.1 conserved hypothetical protein [Xenorhabdus bovienii str. oregonense]